MTRLAILAVIAGVCLFGHSERHVLAKTGQAADAKDAVSAVDPDAIDAVKKMGAYLRSLKVFQVQGDVTHDDVLEDGLIVQSNSKIDMLTAKPDRMRVEVTGDDKQRLYLYDGKTFTAWGKLTNYYATVPAPPTIPELFQQVQEKFDIELPLIDLFKWGTNEDDINKIKTAIDAGPTTVEGVTCEQYVFHQEGVDWQVWIQLGDYPLPRRLVITTLTDEARPQHTITLAWNLAPSFNDAAFVFDPPPDAKRILFEGQTADDIKKGK
ncbi:MAG TPA: DUF2092 domain-containing protein [Edaphobacter sp.]|jgi:hypothetical protein|nr:DUF2092 domain-containing protein [Edaphobacter sp.]